MPELKLADGGHLAYRDTGAKAGGLTFLFLHGWVTGGGFFDKQVAGLGAAHRVVVPDLRGHGASSPLPAGGDIATLADDVAALAAALGLEHVILVGWSLGATTAFCYLERHGAGRLAGLVIEDMTPKVVNENGWTQGSKGTVNRTDALDMFDRPFEKLCRSLVRVSLARDNSPAAAEVDALAALAERNDPASMKALWHDLLDRDHRDFLPSVSLPVLVTGGARSQFYGPHVDAWFAGNMPDARLKSFENSGHAPHLEQAEEFNSTIVEFGLGCVSPA